MIEKLIQIVAPHHCYGCDKTGPLLCNNCKYDIISEPFGRCLGCGLPVGPQGVCRACRLPYSRAWVVGERRDKLEKIINSYKFERLKAAHHTLGDLLDETISQLPAETVVVAVPTISSHIRQRGYDHALLLARYIARQRNITLSRCLVRATNTKQRGASGSQRAKQAKQAFRIRGEVKPGVPYLLIDDVVTTGATVKYAAKTLKDAGASEVWVAAIARNPLD